MGQPPTGMHPPTEVQQQQEAPLTGFQPDTGFQPSTGNQPSGDYPSASIPPSQPDPTQAVNYVDDVNYWDGMGVPDDNPTLGDESQIVEASHSEVIVKPQKPKSKSRPTVIPTVSVMSSPDPRRGSGVSSQPFSPIRLPLPKFKAGGSATIVKPTAPTKVSKAPEGNGQLRLSLHSGFTPPRPARTSQSWGNFPSPQLSPEKEQEDDVIPSGEEDDTQSRDGSQPKDESLRAWDDLVSVIGSNYNIGERSPLRSSRRVVDPLDEPSEPTTRSRLPLFQSVVSALEFTQKEVASSVPSKGKYPCPMAKGKFPKMDKFRKAHPPSGRPTFLKSSPLDSAFSKMGKAGNPLKEVNKIFLPSEAVKTLEEHQRVALSALSSSLWSLAAAEKLLSSICPTAPTNSGLQDAADLVAASRRWLSTSTDRLVVSLSSTMLMRRDKILELVDPLLPTQRIEQLRAAPFTATTLFGDQAVPALAELTQAREANRPTAAIKEMARALIKTKPSRPLQPTGQKKPFTKGKQSGGLPVAQAYVKPATSTTPSNAPLAPISRKRFRGKKGRGGKQN
jgi:hypothetical protein